MRIIKTQQDITTLQLANLFPTLLPDIQIHFNQLRDEIGVECECLFVLDRYGYIVILEAGDNLYDLECLGLHREDCGLLGSMPE